MSVVWSPFKQDEQVLWFIVSINYLPLIWTCYCHAIHKTFVSICKHWPCILFDITDFNELGTEAYHWLPLSAGVKYELSHTSVPPNAFMACIRTTYLSSFCPIIQLLTFSASTPNFLLFRVSPMGRPLIVLFFCFFYWYHTNSKHSHIMFFERLNFCAC